MKEMIKAMVQEMVMQSIQEVMSEMLGGTQTAQAAVTSEKPAKKVPQTLSKEDFLSLVEEEAEPVAFELDFVVFGNKTARYNRSVPSDIWTANHIAITNKYGAKWSKKNGGYVFETSAQLRNFLASYQIKTELDENDKKAIEQYKKERAQKRAEYYANLAK